MTLTYPGRGESIWIESLTLTQFLVTPHSIAYFHWQELQRNGPTVYLGARYYVIRDTGERVHLRYNKRAVAFLSSFVLFSR